MLLAIPSRRATPQSGAPHSSKRSEGQCTMGRRDRTCIRCARSCAMHVQTDTHIHTHAHTHTHTHTHIYIYIYKYHGISNEPRLLASLRSLCSPLGNHHCLTVGPCIPIQFLFTLATAHTYIGLNHHNLHKYKMLSNSAFVTVYISWYLH